MCKAFSKILSGVIENSHGWWNFLRLKQRKLIADGTAILRRTERCALTRRPQLTISKTLIRRRQEGLVMRISEIERQGVQQVIAIGAAIGYGNLISHLQTAWARTLMEKWDMTEETARLASGGTGYPFKMQDDLVNRGEWDESGKAYSA